MSTIHEGAPLYRTNDGRIVAQGSTDAAFLVVGTGGTIPEEHAAAVKAYHADTSAKAVQPEANKRKYPAENK